MNLRYERSELTQMDQLSQGIHLTSAIPILRNMCLRRERVPANFQNFIVSQHIFIQRALVRKQGAGEGGSIYFLKSVFKTNSKVKVSYL